MPGRHRGGQRRRMAVHESDAERAERTGVFGKTKLCKFHILGTCTKGSDCSFAHHPDEMKALPDLSFTKLCKTLVRTGRCEDPECTYAHTKEELRGAPPVALRTMQGFTSRERASPEEAAELLRQMAQAGRFPALSVDVQQISGADVFPAASATKVMQRASHSFGSSLALIEEEQKSDEDSTSASDNDGQGVNSNERFNLTVKNTFIDLEPEQPSKLGFRAIKTAGGRLNLLWQETADDQTECF